MYYFESNVIVTHLCFQPNMSTADRKKKNFSFSRKFPFMKSKDNIGSQEELSTDERKLRIVWEHSPALVYFVLIEESLEFSAKKENFVNYFVTSKFSR